jgi:biopolymer transport protein ExbB
MIRKHLPAALVLWLIPALAFGWWNEDWASRRQVIVDAGATGADVQETLRDFPLLVRLHAGNFGFFSELAENGRDLRFLEDDQAALKHAVEKVDALDELGLVWVRLPEVRGGTSTDAFWMYYGNGNAPEGSESTGLYDVSQALVYHFAEGETLPRDATAYGTHAAAAGTTVDPAGWIGAAARFAGTGPIAVNAAPPLAITPEKGWTFSAWAKIEQDQAGASLVEARDAAGSLELVVRDGAAVARFQGAQGQVQTPPARLAPGQWHHLALVARKDRLDLYVDGAPAGQAALALPALNPTLGFGRGLVGLMDEVQVAGTARSADWIKLSFRSQSPDFTVLNFGQDEAGDSGGGGHFMVIVENVTVDGWVVIGLTGIMLVVAVVVMITKTLVINRIAKDNRAFLTQYRTLDAAHLGALDQDDRAEDEELAESDFLTALVGKHDHFQSSTLYHLYHAGIRELKLFLGDPDQPVTPEAWNLLRVRLDSQVVRESQRLNSGMVLLTISIAGGPFLGLLGTVVGVMITFAVIAATGDVNINSIAPGIAAALLATVAGLAVAIPALFAYNYLLTRIKDIVADMRVFTDEFLALLSMRVAQSQSKNGHGKARLAERSARG